MWLKDESEWPNDITTESSTESESAAKISKEIMIATVEEGEEKIVQSLEDNKDYSADKKVCAKLPRRKG